VSTPLSRDFFARDVLKVAPDLVGKLLVRTLPEGELVFRISETEAYRGEEDSACHARHGKTARNAPLYGPPGRFYVYLCYGVHWLLNVVTGAEGEPQGVLIRGCLEAAGPGRLTKALSIDGSLTGEEAAACAGLRFEDDGCRPALTASPRVGIGYATEEDQARPWRFQIAGEGRRTGRTAAAKTSDKEGISRV